MRKNLEFGSDDIETTRERKIFKLIDLEDKQKVKEISAALLGYLRGLGYKGQPSFDLEDIISTTLTQAINKRDEIKNPNDIFWWLLVTAKNYYLNKIKSKKNRPHDSLDTLGDAPNKNLNEEEKLIQKLSREKNLDIVLKIYYFNYYI
jgi:DNA-directed RNA polymerase specialized sigma24 family protein